MKKRLYGKEREEALSFFCERFSLSRDLFSELGLFQTERKIYAGTNVSLQDSLFPSAETAGLAFLRPNGVLKPTTDFLQLVGKHARKNFIELSRDDAVRYIQGEDIDLSKKIPENVAAGYVIVKYKGYILGCANFKEGNMKNQLPKSRRMRIKLE